MRPTLNVGEAVEFGADYYTGSGKKSAKRWYGFILAQSDTHIAFARYYRPEKERGERPAKKFASGEHTPGKQRPVSAV